MDIYGTITVSAISNPLITSFRVRAHKSGITLVLFFPHKLFKSALQSQLDLQYPHIN